MNSFESTQMDKTIYTAYNERGEILAYACRLTSNARSDLLEVATGSARLVADTIVPLLVGTVMMHWQYGRIKAVKLNQKTVKIVHSETGEKLPDLVI